jgi:hypothetical protein
MSRNTLYLLGIWCAVGIPLFALFGWCLYVAYVAVSRGQTEYVVLGVVVILLSIGLFYYIRKRQGRPILRLLQSPSAEALISYYEKTIRPGLIPDADALLAHGCATAYILYGRFPEARSELESVTWHDRPPLIRACQKAAEALLCYLESRDYQQGLAFARSAEFLGKIPDAFPGAATSRAAFAAHVEIGEILTDQFTPTTIEELEDNYQVLPITGKLLVAWALKLAYRKSRNVPKAKAMEEFIQEVGPHCRGLYPVHHGAQG